MQHYSNAEPLLAEVVALANDTITRYGMLGARSSVLSLPERIPMLLEREHFVTEYDEGWLSGELTWRYIEYINWIQHYLKNNPDINMDDVNYVETYYSPRTHFIHVTMT